MKRWGDRTPLKDKLTSASNKILDTTAPTSLLRTLSKLGECWEGPKVKTASEELGVIIKI